MANIYTGKPMAKDLSIGIVVARFNELISERLLAGAEAALELHGVEADKIDVAWVPGAFEIPVIADQMASSKKYDAIITLGAVIRGATSHYETVCNEAAGGVASVSLRHQLPVLFGVLTVDTIEQALERAGTKLGNKGYEVAVGAIEMANLQKELARSDGR